MGCDGGVWRWSVEVERGGGVSEGAVSEGAVCEGAVSEGGAAQ